MDRDDDVAKLTLRHLTCFRRSNHRQSTIIPFARNKTFSRFTTKLWLSSELISLTFELQVCSRITEAKIS